MYCLFFISFFAVAAQGTYVPANLFKDPVAFVSSLADANPATIQKMVDMVNELIDEGQAEKATAIAAHEDAEADYNSAVAEHSDATDAHAIAAGNAAVQTDIFNDKTEAESRTAAIRADRFAILAASQADFDKKDAIMKAEIIRLDDEKAILDQIVVLLEKLLPGVSFIQGQLVVTDYIYGRALLSNEDAAPEAIQNVVDKINAMIGVGEGERAHAISEQANAKKKLEDDTVAHEIAVEDHTKAAGELGQATKELKRLEAILSVKTDELNEALAVMNDKEAIMNEKKTFMDAEVVRLDEEDATLKTVLDLLNNINNH